MDNNADDSQHPWPSDRLGSHWTPFLLDYSFCYHCGKRGTDTTPLKRCKGCNAALYCDKDCQKAAWPVHRTLCRSSYTTNTNWPKELGYAAPFSVVDAVQEWMEIHYYSLKTITQIALFTNGGVDHNLATPHAMVFLLEALSDGSSNRLHPSRAFRIVGAEIRNREHYLECLDALWEQIHVKGREQVLALWRAGGNPLTLNPALAGAFPTAFVVEDVDSILYHCCDVYHPSRHPDDASPDVLTRLAFEDLDTMCRRSIYGGLVFEDPGDYTQILPKGAVYHPVGKGWNKLSAPEILPQVMALDRASRPQSYESGLSWEKIWEVYKNW
ncbi:hypothetical protein V8D89_003641 [Ganoderma adspersum]